MLGTKELLPGTLDMLILKALDLGPMHGYGVLLRIEATSGGLLSLEQGSLYPALQRLEHRGLIESEWGRSKNNRRAKFYDLTRAGRARLQRETSRWMQMVEAVSNVLVAQPHGA
jgi:PadR family transcriptional regulator PadR